MNQGKMVSVGSSQNPDSTSAAEEAAGMALSQLAPTETVSWLLAFCGGRHQQTRFMQALRAQFGDVEIVGGAAAGTITTRLLGYSGYECAVAAFTTAFPRPIILSANGLEAGEGAAGQRLGVQLRQLTNDGDTVLLFYDSIKSGPPPVLYVGSRLMEGLYQGLAGKQLNLIGAGTLSDLKLSDSYVFDGRQAVKHTAVAVALPATVQSHTAIMHGCIPVSSFLEITRIEGAVLYELNGRPALEVLLERLGQTGAGGNLSLAITIGQKHGDPFAPYDEAAYVNRLILSSNPADGSVTLFEADFQVGSRVQIMSRENQLMLESVQKQSRRLRDSLTGQKPVLALYIDCAGRSSAFSGAEVEEASLIQAQLGAETPLLGFYSGVELAPLLGRSRPLDWTGVLTLLTLEGKFGG